ncbi:MAG: hypothetical protein QOG52_1296 [Frankiaceae bacterium]|nr:hypothetical protein [Frankiaceae bacterium]
MDILESGMDRPDRPRSRPRTSAVAALAIVVAGGAYWLHQPDHNGPPPVAVVATPTPTPKVTRSVAPTEPSYPFVLKAKPFLLCPAFLDSVETLTSGEMGLTLISDKRTRTMRDVLYHARTGAGTVRVHAQCGPIQWGPLVGQHVGDANGDYIDVGARRNEPSGPRDSVAIFRADNADGWYRIEAGGPDGRLGDGATLPNLMATIAHTPLINFKPPGAAGQD